MTLTPSPQGEEFFDLDEVINEVEKLVEGKFWPLLIGPKRTGKTSILRIVARELNGIYVDASGIRSVRDLGYSLVDKAEVKLQVDLKFIKVEINKKPTRGVQALLDRLRDSIILIDEVQSLISPWFLRLLANAYNNSQVRFAFTGSMMGLAKSLMGQGKGYGSGVEFYVDVLKRALKLAERNKNIDERTRRYINDELNMVENNKEYREQVVELKIGAVLLPLILALPKNCRVKGVVRGKVMLRRITCSS